MLKGSKILSLFIWVNMVEVIRQGDFPSFNAALRLY
jgi:hypothetical protein